MDREAMRGSTAQRYLPDVVTAIRVAAAESKPYLVRRDRWGLVAFGIRKRPDARTRRDRELRCVRAPAEDALLDNHAVPAIEHQERAVGRPHWIVIVSP